MAPSINFTFPECTGWVEQRTEVRDFHLKRYLELRNGVLTQYKKKDGQPSWRIPLQKAVLGANEYDNYIDIYTPARKLAFTCREKEDRERWLQSMEKCVRWKIDKFYNLGNYLGSGTYASVYEGKPVVGGEPVAVKVISKQKMGEFEKKLHEMEVKVMTEVPHPNLMAALDVLEGNEYIYIIMDLMKGDSLVEVMQEKGPLSENHAREVMRAIFNAVACLHTKGVVHRDIKPENILVQSHEFPFGVRLSDFGAAAKIEDSGSVTKSRHTVGTKGFIAPEYATGQSCGLKVDIFACGVILYLLLANYLPFREDSLQNVQKSAIGRSVEFYSKEFANTSDDVKELIRCLLRADPSQRLSATEALQHPWMNSLSE